ncbi:Glycerophosphocholine phosphodiesterase [Sticta canariensis]|nr:Glycerophosphocholine phosphodiesterase [Sticta canariensis]
MDQHHDHTGVGESPGATRLYLAAQANDEAVLNAILASPAARRDQLNAIESARGWTPLFVACAKGFASIVRLLIDAEANQGLVDFAGWTAKEHAVFRGHLQVAKLLATQEFERHSAPSARLQPRARRPVDYRRQSVSSQIFVYLGPSHTRSNLEPVELGVHSRGYMDASDKTSFGVMIKAQGTSDNLSYSIQLPIMENMVNEPVSFSTEDPEKVTLIFELFRSTSTSDKNEEVIGTGIALLQSLRQGLAPKRESLIRHYTVPILQNGLMTSIGAVTFSVLVITPFQLENPPPKTSLGFWKERGSYPVVGHRGSGANSTVRTELQVGENTFQSFLTAIERGACGVEFDVQLTKDYRPVIYHDFFVKETGGDIPLHGLTFDQFEHLSRSQAPRSNLLSSGEQRYLERNNPDKLRPKARSHSDNKYDDYRSQDLLERIRYTEAGLHGNFKGNLRGCSIQEPSTILEQLLTKLPESVAFDLEIKYPMLWEAEDRNMEFFAIELNFYVDTILAMIFRHCGDRNITLSSFSPEVCIALACKQQAFPILLISKAGSVPVSDVRAGSLQGAIEFATAWDLAGVVMLSDPFVMCPRLLTYAKNAGLVVCSYGHLNNDPECALIQVDARLDAIITDKAHLISQALAKIKR